MSPVRVRQEALFAAKSFLRRFFFFNGSPKGRGFRYSAGPPLFAQGSPFGRAGAKRLRGQARHERTAHAAISRLFVRAILSLRPQITVSILALSVTFGDTSPRGRGFSASASLSCNQTVAFFTLFSKIKGKLKNVLLKKWRICVTLHPSCNGIFGDSGVFSPVFFGSGGRRQSDYHAFFLLFCPFWLFFRPFSLVARGKVW